jgi:hypothetical protein
MTSDGGTPPPNSAGWVRRSVDWLFRNRRTGAITVAQLPNLPLGVFIAAEIVERLAHSASRAATVLRVVAVVALLLWAADEIVRGVNPFRRILGAVVLLLTVASLAFP